MFFSDGSVYDGDFKKDNRDGYGIFVEKNGNVYEGNWKDGK